MNLICPKIDHKIEINLLWRTQIMSGWTSLQILMKSRGKRIVSWPSLASKLRL